MGRNRGVRRDNALPEYVYRITSKNRVIWREYVGAGKFGRTVTLLDSSGTPLPSAANHQQIMTAYNEQVAKSEGHTLSWLFAQYFKSRQYADLSPATKRSYQVHSGTIAGKRIKGGSLFGDTPLKSITPPVVAKYRDSRADARISANRELQLLSAVYSWAIEQGHATSNPAKGVRKFPAQVRDRYIENWEMELVQELAPDYVAVAMELAYLLRARRSEVLALRREDVTDAGVFLNRGKGSEDETTTWTPALREAIQAARAINRGVISPWLLHDPKGGKIKAAAFDTAWQRLITKALESGLKERFTFHDLKAKGVTDHAEQWAGHKSERMRQVYVRKAREIQATR